MNDYRQIILMRTDLKMPKGKMVAQGAHASMIAYLNYKDHPNVKKWLEGSFTKVVLKVDSEETLMDIIETAAIFNVPRSVVVDSGRTVFNGVPTTTCGCIGPELPENLEKLTGHLKLL